MSRFRSWLAFIEKSISGWVLLIIPCLLVAWKDSGAQNNGMWVDRFGGDLGVNGTVNAIAVNDSGVVYVGGVFSEAGGEDVSYIAKWADGVWAGLGNGLDDDVWGLELTPSGTLYAGGDFVLAGGIVSRFVARWTGEAWEALEGLDGRVRAMAAKDTMLFAGGRFGYSGHGPAYKVAQWDGAYWQDVGGGVECPCRVEDNAEVETLALADEGLYVGGYFLKAGGKPASNIALWDGSNWHALGSGTDGTDRVVVSIVVTDSGDVYVGGDFTYAGDVEVNHVARWTGTTWEPLGAGVNGTVETIALGTAGDLWVGGAFTEAGGVPADNVAHWTGSHWEPLGDGVNDVVRAIALHDDEVYVVGDFTRAGGLDANHLAVWRQSGSSVDEEPVQLDDPFLRFDEIYPNPVADDPTIVFHLALLTDVKLDVYNQLGQQVAALLESTLPRGSHQVRWRRGESPAGLYFVRLQAGPIVENRAVILSR